MKLEYGKKSDENVGSDLNYIYIYVTIVSGHNYGNSTQKKV